MAILYGAVVIIVVLLIFVTGYAVGDRPHRPAIRDARLCREAAAIFSRALNPGTLDSDFTILSKSDRTAAEQWLAKYDKEISKS